MKNIALIGFMGAGKTTVAKIVAQQLCYTLREIDEDIIRKTIYSNINEIFAQQGEPQFRMLEKEAVANAVKGNKQVISCGGGVVSSVSAMKMIKQKATVIFLHAGFKTIVTRLKDTTSRPLFKDIEQAMALYAKRLPLYEAYADIKIETDNKTPEHIASKVLAKLKIYES